MTAETDFAGRQLLGARPLQEDAYSFSETSDSIGRIDGVLIVVADGMGGHNAGERASETAVRTFVDSFHAVSGPSRDRLAKSLTAADDAIRKELQRDPDLEGMGCTLVAAIMTNAGVEWISVGDSPLYLLRGSTLKRLNEDHSLRPVLQELAERDGQSVPERHQAASANILRSALTGQEIEMIDQSPEPITLQAGDLILAATDGIHTLNEREIIATCADSESIDASVLADGLVQAIANVANPKQDNVTIAIMKPRLGS